MCCPPPSSSPSLALSPLRSAGALLTPPTPPRDPLVVHNLPRTERGPGPRAQGSTPMSQVRRADSRVDHRTRKDVGARAAGGQRRRADGGAGGSGAGRARAGGGEQRGSTPGQGRRPRSFIGEITTRPDSSGPPRVDTIEMAAFLTRSRAGSAERRAGPTAAIRGAIALGRDANGSAGEGTRRPRPRVAAASSSRGRGGGRRRGRGGRLSKLRSKRCGGWS